MQKWISLGVFYENLHMSAIWIIWLCKLGLKPLTLINKHYMIKNDI